MLKNLSSSGFNKCAYCISQTGWLLGVQIGMANGTNCLVYYNSFWLPCFRNV